MYCVGFFFEDFCVVYECLWVSGKVVKIVMMSYFFCVDELDCLCIEEQFVVFVVVSQGLEGEISLCNLLVVFGWLKVFSDWVCLGILFYGVMLFECVYLLVDCLCLVMILELKVISVCDLLVGELVGYGVCYSIECSQCIGVVVMGYVDGYLCYVVDGIFVFIDGKLGCLVGWVLMDMFIVDFIDYFQVGLGSWVELWGLNVLVGVLVVQFGSIFYQLLCNLKRVLCVYFGV